MSYSGGISPCVYVFGTQTSSAAMGSPLSPVVTNLYMEAFEQEAIERALDKPKLWVRYVDDTFVIWQHGQDKLESFIEHLNSVCDTIKFMMEIEQNGQLSFLDVLVEKRGEQPKTESRFVARTNQMTKRSQRNYSSLTQKD